MKRIPWFEIILVIAVMSMSLYAALSDPQNLSMRWFIRDDAYYYFKVAQNISEGHGSTFDGINPTNGYHPLWLWVCIPIFALARFDLILPLRILLLVMSGLSVATAILMYRLLGKVFTPAIGATAAIYWVFSQDVLGRVYQQGLETGIASFFIMLLVYKFYDFEKSWRDQAVTKKQIAILGVIATLVMFSRLDLAFFAGMAGIWIVLRKYPMRYLLPLDIVAILVSVLLAFVIRIPFKDYYDYSTAAVIMIALSLAIKLPGLYLFGLYQHSVISNISNLIKRLLLFIVTTSVPIGGLMILITLLDRIDGFPRSVIIVDMVISAILIGITRAGLIGLGTDQSKVGEETSPISQFRTNWKIWLNDGLVYYGVVFGALAVYMAANKIAFGTFSPVSGQIKRWWGSLSGNVYGGAARTPFTFFGVDYAGDGNAWHPISSLFGGLANQPTTNNNLADRYYLIFLALFILVCYLLLLTDKHKARTSIAQLSITPLFASTWLQIFYYHVTGYSAFKTWYWVSELILVVIGVSFILGMLQRLLAQFRYTSQTTWALASILGITMGFSFWNYIYHTMPYGKDTQNLYYNDLSYFLEQHTEPGSIIGMTGGGNAGYFIHNRTVINMDGLINSYSYFQLLQSRSTGEYLAQLGMNYVLADSAALDRLPYRGQYAPYLEWMDIRFGGKDLMRYHSTPQP